MAKARTLTFTFPDGKIRKVRTARNYSHAVKATFRVQSKFAYNGKYYLATEKHLCGRPDLMEKCVAKYSSLEGAEIMVAPLTNDPWANNQPFSFYSPITPKTMNAFREKALWENNQRLLSQKDILKTKLAEVKEIRKNIAELEAMRTAIKEVK